MGTNNSLQHISNTQSLDFDILNIPTPDMNPEQSKSHKDYPTVMHQIQARVFNVKEKIWGKKFK